MTEENAMWLVFGVVANVLVDVYFYKLGWWRGYMAGLIYAMGKTPIISDR